MLRWRTFRETKLTRLKTSSLNVRIRQRETDDRLIQIQLETEMPDQAANLAPEVRFD
jgi:capsular polysaccharide biosynthesis protein